MKKLFLLISVASIMIACQTTPKRIVSDTTVQTEVAGLTLCAKTTPNKAERAFEQYIGGQVLSQTDNAGPGRVIRMMPYSRTFAFGGASWTYVDVLTNKENEIISVSMTLSCEEYKSVELPYQNLFNSLTAKYGNPNKLKLRKDVIGAYCFWTDDTNSISLSKEESTAINGEVRSFCTLRYVNIALQDAYDASANEL